MQSKWWLCDCSAPADWCPASPWAGGCHPPSWLHPVLLFSMMPRGGEYPFVQLGSAVLAMSPASFLCPPSLLTVGAVWKLKSPRLGVSATQQRLNHQCVIRTVIVLNPEHSTVPATGMIIHSIPAFWHHFSFKEIEVPVNSYNTARTY